MTTAYILPLLLYGPFFIAPLLMRDWITFNLFALLSAAIAVWLIFDPVFAPFWASPLGQVMMLWGYSGIICGLAARGLILGLGRGSPIFAAAFIASGLVLPPMIVFGVAEFTSMDLQGAARSVPLSKF